MSYQYNRKSNKISDISLLCSIVIFCIFTIATTSIGIECYNSNENFDDDKKNNFNFLIFNLVCAIFVMLAVCIYIYIKIKSPV